MQNQKILENINLIKKKITDIHSKSLNAELKIKKKIEIIAISKRQPLERIISALNIGHKTFGENQIQELIPTLCDEATTLCLAEKLLMKSSAFDWR